MSEGVFRSIVSKPPYKALIKEVDSCGTAAYHVGDVPDSRTMSTLEDHGIRDYEHFGRQVISTISFVLQRFAGTSITSVTR